MESEMRYRKLRHAPAVEISTEEAPTQTRTKRRDRKLRRTPTIEISEEEVESDLKRLDGLDKKIEESNQKNRDWVERLQSKEPGISAVLKGER